MAVIPFLLIFIPLLGGAVVLVWPSDNADKVKKISLGVALTTLAVASLMMGLFDYSKSNFLQMQWEPFKLPMLGVDGLSLFFVLLTAVLVPLGMLASWLGIEKSINRYYGLFLILESLIIGSFLAANLLDFYIFFEAVLVPMFFLIGIWGGKERIAAAFKFFLYTMAGSVLLMVGVVFLFYLIMTKQGISEGHQHVVFWCFFLAFAVKVPMWPVHTWLPAAHVQAPTGVSMILAGVLLKMGGYGFIRFMLPIAPIACYEWRWLLMGLSAVAIVYGSLVALAQTNMKRLVAYSSIAHMGVVTLGMFSATLIGLTGAVFHMISHGVVSAGLFFVVGILYQRTQSLDIADYGGVAKAMPLLAIGFLILTCAGMGVPGTSGFIGELMTLIGTYKVHPIWAATIAIGLVLSAIYGLRLYGNTMFGPLNKNLPTMSKLEGVEKVVLGILVVLTLLLGLYPNCILKTVEKSTLKTHRWVQSVKQVSGE